mmetsp:Transcript_8925/g.27474  ORF Transcript_8925/g.27474 Transcript_8925/m.27474 type:complete len:257 (+) Transcript_8925:459-1229(+)
MAVRIRSCGSLSSASSFCPTTGTMRSRASLSVGAPKTSLATRQPFKASKTLLTGILCAAKSSLCSATSTWAASGAVSPGAWCEACLADAARRKALARSSSSRRVSNSGSSASKSRVRASQSAGTNTLTARASSSKRTASYNARAPANKPGPRRCGGKSARIVTTLPTTASTALASSPPTRVATGSTKARSVASQPWDAASAGTSRASSASTAPRTGCAASRNPDATSTNSGSSGKCFTHNATTNPSSRRASSTVVT